VGVVDGHRRDLAEEQPWTRDSTDVYRHGGNEDDRAEISNAKAGGKGNEISSYALIVPPSARIPSFPCDLFIHVSKCERDLCRVR